MAGILKKMTKFITILFLIFILAIPAFAETIVLKSGRIIEGTIIENTDDYIKLQTPDGQSLYFCKNTISDIKNDNSLSPTDSRQPSYKTGLLDYSNDGYMLFLPGNINASTPILICLPGWGIKTKQDINNWAFSAGKKSFVVAGLDIDYNRINSPADVDATYLRILKIIESLTKEYPIDKNKIYLAGTSAGGILSMALALRYPGKFAAAGIVSGGRLGFGAEEELKNAKNMRFFMIHGQKDESIPFAEFQSTRKQLERNKAIIEYKTIPDGKHTLNSSAYKTIADWLSDFDGLHTPRD